MASGDVSHWVDTMRFGKRICRSETLLARVWSGCSGETFCIPRTESAQWRFISIALGLMEWRPCNFVVTGTWCYVFGCSTICLADPVTFSASSWNTIRSMVCFGLIDGVFNVRISCKVRLCASITTSCECQETTLRSAEKIPQMKRFMNEVPSKISSARCRALLDLIKVFGLLGRR